MAILIFIIIIISYHCKWKVHTRSRTLISVLTLSEHSLHILDQRKSEADRIRERYPDRIPVICEKSKSSKLPDIDKTKWVTTLGFCQILNRSTYLFNDFRYLVPNDLTAYHFNYIIRKRIKLPEKDSLYFFVNGRNLLKGGKLKLD
jgi:hypothetical protein